MFSTGAPVFVFCVVLLALVFADEPKLVHFSAAEERILDDGIRRSSHSRPQSTSADLVEFTEEEEEALNRGWAAARTFQSNRSWRLSHVASKDYCAHYRSNFAYYCLGTSYGSEPLVQKITKFCPSYKSRCETQATGAARDPFEVLQHRTSPDFPDVNGKHSKIVAEEREQRLRTLQPCTPDCDARVWSHCTQECKCDYNYPRVQRFCNPPPIPFFLNTCRLWYHGCPKYQQYHYASQFIYSKAEKGKTLGGMSPQTTLGGASTHSGFGSSMGGGGMFSTGSGVSTPFGGFGMGASFG